jgi:hypothetical protein
VVFGTSTRLIFYYCFEIFLGRVFSIMEKTVTHEVGKPRGPEPLQEEAEQQLYPRITPLQRAQQIVGVSPTKNVSFAGRRAVYVMAAASATEKVFERAGANRGSLFLNCTRDRSTNEINQVFFTC